MATDVDICNTALLKLGQGTKNLIVASLSEDGKNARLCNELYGAKRDELLRAHLWNFAVTRLKLSQNATAPVFGFDHAYDLPADWLRTIDAFDNEDERGSLEYRQEGQLILSSADDVWLKYLKRVTDPNEMTPDFREALATLLAWDLALPVANSNPLAEQMEKRHLRALRMARSSDALEDRPEEFPAGSWLGNR